MTAPQTEIPPAANVLATLGTVLWCMQLVPQVWHNWRRKRTEGLPGLMMLVWAVSSVPFGVYAIVQQFAIAIQIQPQIFGVLAVITWAQTLFYNDGWSLRKSLGAIGAAILVLGGLEVLLIYTLRIPYGYNVDWPIVMIGIIADVLLALGFVPAYWEIWKRRGRVVGIDWIFLCIDLSGALLSMLAVVFQQTFDALGGSLYIVVMALEVGIFVSHGVWLLCHRGRRGDEESGAADSDTEQHEEEKGEKGDGHEGGSPHEGTAREAVTEEAEAEEATSVKPSEEAPAS